MALPASQKPNVIVCMCDQLRAFEVGCYGNKVIQTPNIDRLAADGVRFHHAVSNNPVCMPARSALISGQYSRTCVGRLGNYAEKTEDGKLALPEYPSYVRSELLDPTLPEVLRDSGYDTALIGKWHIQPAPKTVGFDYSLFPFVHHRHTKQTFIENEGPGEEIDGFSVEFEADRVSDYLAQKRDKPFFLFYNISPPHMPLLDAPEKYLRMYSPDEVPLRPNVYVDGKLPYNEHWFKIYLWDFLYYQNKESQTNVLPCNFDFRQLVALYYGMTTWMDDMVGRMMGRLKANGLDENTIVIFTSDHGDHLGSHHLFNKGTLLEESIRIPMIFNAPFLFPKLENHEQVASLVDIMPTVLDLCGVSTPSTVQGRSLAPILNGRRDALDDNAAYIENGTGEIGIRTPTHLYAAQRNFEGGLNCANSFFSLTHDPYQQHNLAEGNEEAETSVNLRQRLVNWNKNTPWFSHP